MPGTDDLWGGTLVSLSFDVVAWTLQFDVVVLSDGTSERYQLVLDEVSEWHASRGIPLPWTYAELTEVRVSELDDGVSVEMVLWDDETSLTARCARLRVDRLT